MRWVRTGTTTATEMTRKKMYVCIVLSLECVCVPCDDKWLWLLWTDFRLVFMCCQCRWCCADSDLSVNRISLTYESHLVECQLSTHRKQPAHACTGELRRKVRKRNRTHIDGAVGDRTQKFRTKQIPRDANWIAPHRPQKCPFWWTSDTRATRTLASSAARRKMCCTWIRHKIVAFIRHMIFIALGCAIRFNCECAAVERHKLERPRTDTFTLNFVAAALDSFSRSLLLGAWLSRYRRSNSMLRLRSCGRERNKKRSCEPKSVSFAQYQAHISRVRASVCVRESSDFCWFFYFAVEYLPRTQHVSTCHFISYANFPSCDCEYISNGWDTISPRTIYLSADFACSSVSHRRGSLSLGFSFGSAGRQSIVAGMDH